MLTNAVVVGLPVALGYYAQALSLDGTDAGKSAFLCSLAVVIVPVIQRLVPSMADADKVGDNGDGQSTSSFFTVFGAPLLAVAGVALLELGDASLPTIGDAWGLLQALAFGIGFMLNERAARLAPAFSITTSAIQLAVVSVLATLWATVDVSMHVHVLTLPHMSDAFESLTTSGAVVYAGVVSTALAVVLANVSLSRVSAGELTVLLSTEPVWAAAVSAGLLGERMGGGGFIGAFLILVACIINQGDALPGGKPLFHKVLQSATWRSIVAPVARVGTVLSCMQGFINRMQPPSS